MTDEVIRFGGYVTELAGAAPAAEPARRTITGLALPWDAIGRTSAGAVTVARGAVQIPTELSRVKLLDDHRPTGKPVGYLASVTDSDAGLVLDFQLGTGPDSDAALAAAAEHVTDGLSVELVAVQRSGDGRTITAATLEAVALVAIPAFNDARVSTVHAQATTAKEPAMTPEEIAAAEAAAAQAAAEAAAAAATAATAVEPPAPAAPAAPIPFAAAPASLTASAARIPRTLAGVLDTLHAVRGGSPDLTAALADITRSANPWVSPDGWVGELWSGLSFQREIVPLLTHAPLAHWKVTGWRWKVKPTVGDYAGDKAEVPTNTPTTESVSVEASRLAGAHDIDRKFFDFNDAEFIRAYFAAMTESYAMQSDAKAAEFVLASATAAGSAPDLLRAVARGARSVKQKSRAKATYALVNDVDMESLLDFTKLDVPEFLGLLGIEPAKFVQTSQVPAGTVIVGAKPAATFYELGGSPIRVETVNLAHGGRDAGVFGYYATLLHNANGIAKVSYTPPVEP